MTDEIGFPFFDKRSNALAEVRAQCRSYEVVLFGLQLFG
jgi:hypothetical protein